MKLFEACVKPILLYCSEVWSLPQLIKSKDITNFESNYEKVVPNRIQVKYSKYILEGLNSIPRYLYSFVRLIGSSSYRRKNLLGFFLIY
jgi:hypothetical protein